MWQLIKYEIRSRIGGFIGVLAGIIVWDIVILIIYTMNKEIEIQLFIEFSTFILTLSLFIVYIYFLVINFVRFFNDFKTNQLSFLCIFPIQEKKMLLSKLFISLFEFIIIYLLQISIIVINYWFLLQRLRIANSLIVNNFSNNYPNIVYLFGRVSLSFSQYFIMFVITILLFSIFIINLKTMIQNSTINIGLNIVFIIAYLTTFIYFIVKTPINAFPISPDPSFIYKIEPLKVIKFVICELIVFLIFLFGLSHLIYLSYKKRAEF